MRHIIRRFLAALLVPLTLVPPTRGRVFCTLGLLAGGYALWLNPLWVSSPAEPAGHTTNYRPVSADEDADAGDLQHQPRMQVAVTHPGTGGIERRMVQTASIEAFESVGIHARVSGYLQSMHADIGSTVEAGQVLAELEVPELAQEVERRRALLKQARGEAAQAEARLKVAQAELETASAAVSEAEAGIKRHTATRGLREKEFARLQQLARDGAIEARLLDEKQHELQLAAINELHATEFARVARAKQAEVGPRVELARAERDTARAAVDVAASALKHAEIMQRYTKIVAPFPGVVTQRNFDSGDFVRAATEGGSRPLFRVSRTDRMKAVVSVPDRFVPYISTGDPVSVRIDALHGRAFEGTVARLARSQDRQTRTMRVEIDLPNPDGRLIDGMYGSVIITSPPPDDSLLVPSASLVSGTENGRGAVYVIRSGLLRRVPVWIGQNDGTRAEVLSGLSVDDFVVAEVTDQITLGEGMLASERFELSEETWFVGSADAVPIGR